MSHTVNVHILDPETTVRAVKRATGRIAVEIEAESFDVNVTIACVSLVGEKGLFSDPIRLAAQLEMAARNLRLLAAPTDPGDVFVYPAGVGR